MTRRPVVPQAQRGWRASQRMAPGGRLYSESPVVPTRQRVLFAGEAEDVVPVVYVGWANDASGWSAPRLAGDVEVVVAGDGTSQPPVPAGWSPIPGVPTAVGGLRLVAIWRRLTADSSSNTWPVSLSTAGTGYGVALRTAGTPTAVDVRTAVQQTTIGVAGPVSPDCFQPMFYRGPYAVGNSTVADPTPDSPQATHQSGLDAATGVMVGMRGSWWPDPAIATATIPATTWEFHRGSSTGPLQPVDAASWQVTVT